MPSESMSTVEKAVDVLFHLHSSDGPAGVSEIGRALGIPKSNTHRLLVALCRRGLVEREPRGRYRPGMGLVALGLGVLDADPLVVAARPQLEALAADIGETCFLVGSKAGRLLVLDKAEGSGFLRAAPRVGSELPAHATAVGKLYRAFAPQLLADFDPSATAFTENTIRDSAGLERAAQQARDQGWAANRDEWIVGMSVLSAPVLEGTRMFGAIALAASSPRLEQLGGDDLAEKLIDAAAAIAARLTGGAQ